VGNSTAPSAPVSSPARRVKLEDIIDLSALRRCNGQETRKPEVTKFTSRTSKQKRESVSSRQRLTTAKKLEVHVDNPRKTSERLPRKRSSRASSNQSGRISFPPNVDRVRVLSATSKDSLSQPETRRTRSRKGWVGMVELRRALRWYWMAWRSIVMGAFVAFCCLLALVFGTWDGMLNDGQKIKSLTNSASDLFSGKRMAMTDWLTFDNPSPDGENATATHGPELRP
jgi:hypothetical protein